MVEAIRYACIARSLIFTNIATMLNFCVFFLFLLIIEYCFILTLNIVLFYCVTQINNLREIGNITFFVHNTSMIIYKIYNKHARYNYEWYYIYITYFTITDFKYNYIIIIKCSFILCFVVFLYNIAVGSI